MTNLSKELCEICGIEPKRVEKRCKECDLIMEECGCFDCYKEVYPDFEQPENYKKLQEVFIECNHSITLSRGWYAISNGDTDFVNDMYDTSFEIHGGTFLKAVCNYLMLWIEETTRVGMPDGTYSEPKDTSHKLTREECVYPRGYDDLLKDIEKIKQAIKETEWVYG